MGTAQGQCLRGPQLLSPGAERLPSRHGEAENGQFRAVKFQTADKYVKTSVTVIHAKPARAFYPERLPCPGTGSGRTPLGPPGSAASNRPFCSGRAARREGTRTAVTTGLFARLGPQPGADPAPSPRLRAGGAAAPAGPGPSPAGPGSSPALSESQEHEGQTRAAVKPRWPRGPTAETLSPSGGTGAMGSPVRGLWRGLREGGVRAVTRGAPRGQVSGAGTALGTCVKLLPGLLPSAWTGKAKGKRGSPASVPGYPGLGTCTFAPSYFWCLQ